MIAVRDLCDELSNEAERRDNAGQRLRVVRVHPETFQRIADGLSAKVEAGEDRAAFMRVHTAGGTVRLQADPDAAVADHLYFEA